MRTLVTFPRRKLPQIADADLPGIAHWSMDDETTTDVVDVYGFSDLTADDTTTIEAPIYQHDASAKGRGRETSTRAIGGASTSDQRTDLLGEWTFEAIVRVDSLTTDEQAILVHAGTGATSTSNALLDLATRTDGRLRCRWHSGTLTARDAHSRAGAIPADGKHHHVLVRKRLIGSTYYVSFFVDGAHVGTSAMSANAADGADGSWSMGRDVDDARVFDGAIFDVRIVARAMDEAFGRTNALWCLQRYDLDSLTSPRVPAEPAPAAAIVTDGLTHWSAADDTPLEPGSNQQVFLDKSGHTFEIDALELQSAFRLRDDDGGAFVPNALNGRRGFLCASGEDYLHLVQMDDSLLDADASRGSFVRPSNILGASFTIQWLVHVPHITVNTQPIFKMIWGAGVNDELHIDCTFQPDVHLHNNSYSIFDAAFDTTPEPPARLLTIRCVAGVVSLYLDDDFATPVATMTFTTSSPGASNGHRAMECLAESTSFAPTHFELMTYNRALTDEELAANHAYLSGAGRWGDWT